MLRTRIKICGITRLEDALVAIDAGVDALGFVFVPESKRYISPKVAQQIIDKLPAYIETVGLVMNPSEHFFVETASVVNVGCWQFHGQESAADIHQLLDAASGNAAHKRYRYTKAIAAGQRTSDDVYEDIQQFPDAAGLLIDGHLVGEMGGSGQRSNWSAIHQMSRQMDENLRRKLILAGGINAGNCDEAITTVAPYAIDLSSGVELSPGIKCSDKIRHLCDTVRRFNTRQAASLSQ